MNHSGSKILIPFSKSVALSSIVRLLLALTFDFCHSISIAPHYASAITCTIVFCCTFTCTSVDSCCFVITMLYALVSFYIICASTNCCSTTSSSSNSSMNIKSTGVVLGHVCSFAHQCHLFLHKNSIANVPIVSIF